MATTSRSLSFRPRKPGSAALRLEALRGPSTRGLPEEYRFKTYLVWTWLDGLIRHPRILDGCRRGHRSPTSCAVSTDFFIKEPHDPGFVSWHQDSTYWGLEPPEVITAWLGLTDSTEENGCVPRRARQPPAGPGCAPRYFRRGQPAVSRAGGDGGGRRGARESISGYLPGRSHSTTSWQSTDPGRTPLRTVASGSLSATYQPTCARPWGSESRPCSCEESTSTETST